MKANIWGEEVSCCGNCKYYDGTGGQCMYSDTAIMIDYRNDNEIHPDCPFIQPITKEVFEELGFIPDKFIQIGTHELINEDYSSFIFKHKSRKDRAIGLVVYAYKDKRPNLYRIWNKHPQGGLSGDPFYIGKIHNPEHLKFILNSIL